MTKRPLNSKHQCIHAIFSHLLPKLSRYSVIVLLSIAFISESVGATPKYQGLQIAQQPGTPQDATRAAANKLTQQGFELFQQGTAESKRQAIEKLQQALKLWRQLDDQLMQATTLFGIGSAYMSLEDIHKALEYLNQALPLFRAANNQGEQVKLLEAYTLLGIGSAYLFQADAQQALDNYSQALSLFQALGNKKMEATTLHLIGGLYRLLGDKQKALDNLNKALALFRGLGDKANEASTLQTIANVYLNTDKLAADNQKALVYYNQALPLFRSLANKGEEASTLLRIGRVYDYLGHKQKALVYYNQALPLFLQMLSQYRAGGNKLQESSTLSELGDVYTSLGEKKKALEFYHQALSLDRALGNKVSEGFTLYWMAKLEYEQGNFQKALALIEPEINLIEDVRSHKINNQELRTSFFATVQNSYKLYIDLLMQLHKKDPSKGYDALALNISERSRARSLLELLTEARADIRQGVDPKLLEQERNLQQQIEARKKIRIEILSGKHTPQQEEKINQEIAELLDKYSQVLADIRANSPRYAAITQPKPLTLEQIQSSVVDDNTILLQYSLGKERSYLWLVSKTGMKSYELPKASEIETVAKKFYQGITGENIDPRGGINIDPNPNAEGNVKLGNKLSQMLLQPVAGELGNKRLLIVADGILQYIPFAALPTPGNDGGVGGNHGKEGGVGGNHGKEGGVGGNHGKEGGETPPLLVGHEIVNAPSASTIAVLRNEMKNRHMAVNKLAVLADPVFSKDDERVKSNIARGVDNSNNLDLNGLALQRSSRDLNLSLNRLKGTREEADKILSLVPELSRKSAFDFAANRSTATSPDMSQYQFVHLATHGIFNTKNPEFSGVILSLVDAEGNPQNGFLQLQDIFNLNLNAELVVLSACQTGLGEEVKGEGLVGLTRGFMYAGSPRVAVSLWSVGDEATAELMTKFYSKMLKENLRPAAALRAAQLEMWQNPKYSAPYFWAAFTLQGEWR